MFRLGPKVNKKHPFARPNCGRLALEALEDRCLPSYTVTDLGTLGGVNSYAYGINNLGQVVGYSAISGSSPTHAFLYSDGAMTDLGTLGGTISYAYGINDAGQIAGYSAITGITPAHAFLYDPAEGGMIDLGTLPGDNNSAALGINSSGVVTGYSALALGYATYYYGFTYQDAWMSPIKGMSKSLAINDLGQVVGYTDTTNHAILYQDRHYTDLGTLPGGTTSYAYGINNLTQVVGYSYGHAFLWDAGAMTDLGTLGGANSYGTAINDAGQIVGYSNPTSSYTYHAFIYQDGVMSDLNALVPEGTGWNLTNAQAINSVGQIVGYGTINGQTHAFLLTPDSSGVVLAPVAGSLSSIPDAGSHLFSQPTAALESPVGAAQPPFASEAASALPAGSTAVQGVDSYFASQASPAPGIDPFGISLPEQLQFNAAE